MARTIGAVMVGAMICGPVGVYLGWQATQAVASVPRTKPKPPVDLSGERTAVSQTGEHLVIAWLTATRDNHVDFSSLASSAGMVFPEKAPSVSDVATAAASKNGDLWSVTVAATVLREGQVPQRQYYQVSVGYQDGRMSIVGLPAPVPAPVIVQAPQLAYPEDVTGASGVEKTLAQFLAALAAGQGEVGRYTSPGAAITAIQPAPFTDISVVKISAAEKAPREDRLADGTLLHVLVQAKGVTPDHSTLAVAYALTLTARAGRWEISAIDPTPKVEKRAEAAANTVTGEAGTGPAPAPSTTSREIPPAQMSRPAASASVVPTGRPAEQVPTAPALKSVPGNQVPAPTRP